MFGQVVPKNPICDGRTEYRNVVFSASANYAVIVIQLLSEELDDTRRRECVAAVLFLHHFRNMCVKKVEQNLLILRLFKRFLTAVWSAL